MGVTYHESNARMSQVAVHNGTVYLAGQVPADATVGMRGQTEQVLARIDELLAQAGTSKEHLISAQVWVTDMAEFAEMNEGWEAWVVPFAAWGLFIAATLLVLAVAALDAGPGVAAGPRGVVRVVIVRAHGAFG